MKRIGDKAARVLLTIFGVKTTVIIGIILTFAVILIGIITGMLGTISTEGGKSGKTNAQCVTYQKDGDEEDDEEEDDEGSKPQSTSTKTDSSSAGDSDPFTKGTKAYENAHKVFMAFVNSGMSGESAAGAVGWANSEGSYDIIGRAQGHYGGGINDSISKGAVPTTGGTSNTLGGGGIFQFDPYTKYAPLNSPDWEDADKMVAFVIDAISKGDWSPAYDESGHNWSFQEFAKQTNIDETAMSWNAYERGNMAYVRPEQKKADARKFAEVFEASKYKYDDAKFQKAFGGGGASSNNSSSSSQSSDDDDGDDDEEDSENEDNDSDSSSSSSSSDFSNKVSKKDSDKDKKTIDTDKAIKWYKDKLGKVKYSRDARTGPDSYDHSSALYYALVDGGAKESGSPVDTDSEHDWLKDNGYELVYEGAWSSKDDVQNREKGDVIIWGTKGSSSGDKGQTMLVEDKENIIQCSPSTDGIAENNYGQYRDRITMDYGKVYVYRPKKSEDKKDKDDNKDEVDESECGDSDSSNLSTDTGQPLDVPYTITQLFGASANAGGPNAGSGHTGIDLAAPEGSPIYAVTDGEVVEVNEEAMNIDGNHVMHTLPDGTIIYYVICVMFLLLKKVIKSKKANLSVMLGIRVQQRDHIFTLNVGKQKSSSMETS